MKLGAPSQTDLGAPSLTRFCGKDGIPLSVIIAVCLAAALPVWCQYPGQVAETSKDAPDLRSIAVLEWTGEAGKPGASRLVPVAVLDGGQLQDGGIYLARPQPLALTGEVEYEILQNGKPVGLFDLKSSGQELGSWVGYGEWKRMPVAPPRPSATSLAQIRIDDNVQSDRPVLHRKHHAGDAPPAGSGSGSGSGGSSGASSGTGGQPPTPDPDRPTLKRGKPSGNGLEVAPALMGMPPEMQQAVAVSDARDRPAQEWKYAWANPDEEARMKSALEEKARDALGLKPPSAALIDEQFRVFELAYGSVPTMVLAAHTSGPAAQQKFVTLVAQPDLYGNVLVLLKGVTDGAHLDETPRMRLVDAVDAMADHRGELLFELRGATQRQFALYRVLRGQAEKLFVSGGGEFGTENREQGTKGGHRLIVLKG